MDTKLAKQINENFKDWMKPGAIVAVNGKHWYGEIIDIAVSPTRIMLLVDSPKAVWRNHKPEWVEYDKKQVSLADPKDALERFGIYEERVLAMLAKLKGMRKSLEDQLVTPV